MFEAAIMCIALNIYFEARDQPFEGQAAVGHVVMNRVEDSRYPNDPCKVVTQGETYSWSNGFPVRNRCQFSWFCDGKSDTPREGTAWSEAQMIAFGVYTGNLEDFTNGATHYHADYVLPEWAETKTPVGEVGDHIFYRWEK